MRRVFRSLPLRLPAPRWLMVTLVLALSFAAILILWNDVLGQQRSLNEAHSDNMQWTMSQSLVEYQDMMWALHNARRHPGRTAAALDDFRTRFDIFYSRLDTLKTGPIYRELLSDEVYSDAFWRIQSSMESLLPLIDGPDAGLQRALGRIEAELTALEHDLRSFGLQALVTFSQSADVRRAEVTRAMQRMAALTSAMIALLLAMAAVLFREGRESERRLDAQKRTSARLDTVLNTSLDAIVVADPAGAILNFNRAAERIFGLSEAQARKRRLSCLLRPGATDKTGGEWQPNQLAGRGIVEMQAVTQAGRAFPVELNVETVNSVDGPLLVSFIRDITRRKAAENELIQARDRALAGERAKAGFVAMMSHELRTPLNGILGMLTLLRSTRLSAEQADYAEKMESSGRMLLSHVDDVLDISRAEFGRLDLDPQPTALEPLLKAATDSLLGAAAARGNTISFTRMGALPEHVMIDGGRLRQVLANLLGNAIKFTTGGHVALEAEVLKTAAGDEVLELRVADTGLGMAEDELPRIFEDFETLDRSFARQQTGAGLGLAIVRRIVDAMEGEIFVESEPGEGTLFTVVLPVTAVNISTPAPREEAPRRLPSLTPRSVLVVEDNDINRAVLRGMLRRRNCKVVEAGDGRTGVAVAGSQRFDLVLMDVAMPGIDGIEAARQIRAGGGPSATTPIVAVTAHAGKAEIAEVLRAGFDSVVTKPVESQRIDDLLEGRGLRTAGGGARLFGVDRTLDIEHLDKLRLELGGERLLGLLSRFAAEASTEVGWMASTEVRQAPPADLADRAHRLAGGAASFGAWRLGERLQRVETAARAGQRSALATHLPGLRSDWAETRQRLAAWQQKARDALAQAS